MLLDGYGNAYGMLRQRVTKEQIGDVNCTSMKPLLSLTGKQHYVKWNVPSEACCLEVSRAGPASSSSRSGRRQPGQR
ncbi:hypothetical protein [Nonomuraea rubra]|uniref:hypothetical protein n=1 Tax=Nonomuraea rubra TaxID=46180 RepID=UPI0033F5AFD1